MKKIGIYVNEGKDKDLVYTKLIVDSIHKSKGFALLEPNIAKRLNFCGSVYQDEELFKNCDVVMTVGGDGTFLKAARIAYTSNTPILGINLGSLGFLTDIDRNEIAGAIDLVLGGQYNIEERMMLQAQIRRNGSIVAKDIALNDIVISRAALSRILHLKTYINGDFVDSFPGDGIIVSSPTGSTAYSLSAGGPIVEPDIDLIVVTPICPHILYSRSFITTGDRVVRIVVDRNYDHSAMITVDGQIGYEAGNGDIIEIQKASHRVKMVKIHEKNFFNILRNKIYDRGESLRKNEV